MKTTIILALFAQFVLLVMSWDGVIDWHWAFVLAPFWIIVAGAVIVLSLAIYWAPLLWTFK